VKSGVEVEAGGHGCGQQTLDPGSMRGDIYTPALLVFGNLKHKTKLFKNLIGIHFMH